MFIRFLGTITQAVMFTLGLDAVYEIIKKNILKQLIDSTIEKWLCKH